jgi:polysaccharide chain length determinant protein (PEP-CTERM system associated)
MQNVEQQINLIKIYLYGLWDNKRYFLIPMVVVSFFGWLAVAQMPNQYQTKSRVYADTTNILKPLLSGLAIQEDSKEEVRITSRTLLSREVREDIAQRSDLHLLHTTPEAYENLIKNLKDDIKIVGSKSTDVYDITFTHTDPKMAMRVVELTMKKFVDASAGKSREDAVVAQDFLEGQIAQYQKRLTESETMLAKFKQKNQLLLPGKGGSYYAQLSQLENEIEDFMREVAGKEAQIKGFKNRFLPSRKDSSGKVTNPNIVVETPYDARLLSLKGQLDSLRIRYTDKHPSIVEIIATVDSIEKLQVVSQEQILTQAEKGAITNSSNSNGSVLQEFSFKVSSLSSELDLLQSRLMSSINKRDDLRDMLDLIPGIEAELIELDRDYGNNQRYYNDLVTRRNSAEISRSADEDTQNVKFKIIEEPRVAKQPVGPPRVIFYTLVLVMAVGLGVVLSFLKSQLSAVILNGTHLKTLIGRDQVIGMIENANAKEVKHTNKIKAAIFFAAVAAVLFVYATLLAHDVIFGQSPMIWLK